MSSAGSAQATASVTQKEIENVKTPRRIARLALSSMLALLLLALSVPAASADFGLDEFDSALSNIDGSAYTQAGGHPYAFTNVVTVNRHDDLDLLGEPFPGVEAPDEDVRDIVVDLPPGLIGNPEGFPKCTIEQLIGDPEAGLNARPECPVASQVGIVRIRINAEPLVPAWRFPLHIMTAPGGKAARLGFLVLGTPILIDATVDDQDEYEIRSASERIPAAFRLWGAEVTLWGVPWHPSHDAQRCRQGGFGLLAGLNFECSVFGIAGEEPQSVDAEPIPFLTNQTSCTPPGTGPTAEARVDSWVEPGVFHHGTVELHQPPGFPEDEEAWGEPQGPENCELVPVRGSLEATPTTLDAESPSGLAVRVEVPNPGLESASGLSSSHLKKVEVALPQGITINPSQAEGLGTCPEARFESSELGNEFSGCPENSKVGTVEVVTPLLKEKLPGEVFVAKPYDNPFDSLLAIYVVIEEPERGILIKLPALVETDGTSGRVVTTFDDLPEQPFTSFDFKFREGARAPLITPPTCGTYETVTRIWGHSDPDDPITSRSSFEITRGIGGGSCPPHGTPGFDPGFTAGTANNNAGSYSPTLMRLTRKDGEQDLTKFSAVLPEGLLAKLAGVPWCPDAAIAAAGGKSGEEELASPSCPANSQIGRTTVGAGVGSVLTYVPGSLYLAGPYNGAPLSVVSITPAVAGPFDVGTVVVREALDLDPVTGVASVDGAASDPIPHILKGIPLKLRDLRVYVDRPEFTLNPTSCDPDAIGATLWGSAADVFNPADDFPVARASRFQAASCASLGFKPKLRLQLRGAAKRGNFPAVRAVLTPRAGDANLQKAAVVLPRSAFLEQGHIRTICTRVQYAANGGHGAGCPEASRYGYARAWSPLLDEPLQGPVYLRSSDNELPDMVLALKGLVEIEAVGRIDSVPLGGGEFGIRSVFASVPDAPLSRVVLNMQGGKKGLIVNSRNLCVNRRANRMRSNLTGQNGKRSATRPVVRSTACKKRRKAKRSSHGRSARSSVAASSAVG